MPREAEFFKVTGVPFGIDPEPAHQSDNTADHQSQIRDRSDISFKGCCGRVQARDAALGKSSGLGNGNEECQYQ